MTHIDLFSGIGGFALAIDQVWPNANHIFCEIDPFCVQVLKKHWPNSEVINDIREFTADTDSDRQPRRDKKINTAEAKQQTLRNVKRRINTSGVFILTGGFPCQPFSQAGKRKGKDDDRYLWPEMLRVIKEFRPTFIIGENVAGLTNMAQQQSDINVENETDNERNDNSEVGADGILWEIISQIEQAGYSVQPFIIPACAVNAPHRRDRVWIVANRRQQHGEQGRSEGMETNATKRSTCTVDVERQDKDVTDTASRESGNQTKREGGKDFSRRSWEIDWREVALATCNGSLDDGLSRRFFILPDGRKISYSKYRQQALKSLGNSIVPQVAVEILKAIKLSYDQT